jgi:hypothetical protein
MSMNMPSGDGRESSVIKAVHLASMIGQDRVSADVQKDGNDQTVPGELTYYLRVKPDRRRVKAVRPPHLERRRGLMS